jgi:hypothetical protein
MEWVYKSTDTKLDGQGTLILARRGFLCRSAYNESRAWVPNVRDVQLGDAIHFYHRGERSRLRQLGSYEVVGSEGHPQAAFLGERVDETALFVVDNPEFVKRIDTNGAYQPDPVLGKLTGWLIRKTGDSPPYRASMFAPMQCLARYKP